MKLCKLLVIQIGAFFEIKIAFNLSKSEAKMINGKLFINGNWIDGGKKLESINPANEEIVGFAFDSSQEEVKKAVDAARSALPSWKSLPIEERAMYLMNAVDIIIGMYGELGQPTYLKTLIQDEMGKMPPEADTEVIEASDMIKFAANRGCQLLTPTFPKLDENLWPTKRSIIEYDPFGVVALIKPWNYPFELPLWTLGSALIAGNTVVFKPSEYTPLVGLEIGKIFQQAGLPAGVLNIVTGSKETGKYLIHENVNMISFTGSVETGLYIASECAKSLKKVSLELGGKDPAIVLEDANIELAANGLINGAFCNSGQVCTAIERAYVHEAIYDDLLSLIKEKVEALRLGVDIAPLVSKQQLQKVSGQVQEAVAKGAKVIFGGTIPKDKEKGFWYLPTILTEVNPSMKVISEETFGPVLPISKFRNLAEAVSLANDSRYGLGASIWTKDLDKGRAVSSMIESGMVWINDVNIPFPQCPWGGVKYSGLGVELADAGILEFSRLKHVNVDESTDDRKIYWFPY